MRQSSEKLVEKVLSMDDVQMKRFLSNLSYDAICHLEILFNKYGEELNGE